MTVCALLDANVLYPSLLRDLLIRIAIEGGLRARWSEQILDETFRSLAANRPDISIERLDRTRLLMTAAVSDACVHDYEHLIETLHLPDPDDRHVLAAAVRGGAQVIVTNNLADFPAGVLRYHGLVAEHPDDVLAGCVEREPELMWKVVGMIAGASRLPVLDEHGVVDRMRATGLRLTAARLTRSA